MQTPIPLGGTYQDKFEDPRSGWPRDTDSKVERGYVLDEYRIIVRIPGLPAWATAGPSFTDFDFQVTARAESAGLGTSYGLIFWYEDSDNFHLFRVNPSAGKYSLLAKARGSFETLVDWTPSPFINRFESPNVLRVNTVGTNLQLYANDNAIHGVRVRTVTSGKIGLFAANDGDRWEAHIYFDDLKVTRLR